MHFDEWLLGVVDLVWFGLDFPFFLLNDNNYLFFDYTNQDYYYTNIGDRTAAMQWVTSISLCLFDFTFFLTLSCDAGKLALGDTKNKAGNNWDE